MGVVVRDARADHELSDEQLRNEIARNHVLAAYVKRNGMPDLAENRFLSDQPPWDDHEVRLFYLEQHREIAFARAFILGRPEVQVERYERPLSEQEVAALSSRVQGRHARGASDEESTAQAQAAPDADADDAASAAADRLLRPDERAENAARRAEAAADRVEIAATAAEHAAERTEAIVEKMAAAMTPKKRVSTKASTKRTVKSTTPPTAATEGTPPAAAAEGDTPSAAPTASQ
jgi:hypothetical protein